jgi:hypothetical protein
MSVLIGFPNRIDVATLSGGSWEPLLPLQNLQTRAIAQVARTTNDTASSSVIVADNTTARNFRIFALINHNLSQSATWRVKLGTSSGGAQVYDTGVKQVWNMDFTDILPWESTGWWTGVAEDDFIRTPYVAIVALPDVYTARYWEISITDESNDDGYIQIGRIFAGPAFQAENDASSGMPCRWVDLSETTRSESGALWGVSRPAYRMSDMLFPVLTADEGKWLHDIQRQARTTQEVMFCPFPGDDDLNQHYSFLGRLREMTAIEFPYAGYNSAPLTIEELL